MYNMLKIPIKSDTNRSQLTRSPYTTPSTGRKNYSSLIFKILSILVILIILATITFILVKLFIFDTSKNECSFGFFHPEDKKNKSSCYPCKISNCKKCKGKIRSNICTECLYNFSPEYNSNNEIIKCSLLNTRNNSSSKTEDNVKCKFGYFIPNDSDNKLICEKCSLNNCYKCQGNKTNNECILCKKNYIPKYDSNNKIKYCNKKCKPNEKCKECDLIKNECLNCEKGHYIPSDDEIKLECIKCSLEHCQSCQGTKDSNECDLCEDGYEAEYEKDVIKSCKLMEDIMKNNCEVGEGEKCLTCNYNEKNKCASCNPSYKLVEGKCIFEEKQEIKTTQEIKHTEKIQEVKPTEKIEKTQIIEQTEKTQEEKPKQKNEKKEKNRPTEKIEKTQEISPTQTTEPSQKTQKIERIEELETEGDDPDDPNYDFLSLTAKYILEGKNKLVPIIFKEKNKFIKQMRVDGVLKDSNNLLVEKSGNYLFQNSSKNEYTIKMWLEIKDTILIDLFNSNWNLKSVKFNKVKNSKNVPINSMNNMFFNCSNLIYINISNLDTQYIKHMELTFSKCTSLKSVDLSKNIFKNVENAYAIFSYCHSLTSVNLGTPFPKLKYLYYAFYEAKSIKSIDLSKMNLEKLINLYFTFGHCYSLEYVNLTNVRTDQVKNMKCLFYNNYKLA